MGDFNSFGSIRARHWAYPFMAGLLMLCLTMFYGPGWAEWAQWFGYGLAGVFGAWGAFNFTQHALMVAVDAMSEVQRGNYQLSGNYLADRLREMNSEQLQTLRMYGSTVIQYLVAESEDDEPVGIIYGTEVSLAFAMHFLARSNELQTCPIREFMDGTYIWDWTGENRIQDRDQAREFTAWLIRYGYAEFKGGNATAKWREYVQANGDRAMWSPAKVLRRLGLLEETA